MLCNLKYSSLFAAMTTVCLLGAGAAHAGNIITFNDASQKCGGAVMCSYDGTTGYLNNGMGRAFNLSTIRQWFQIDVAGRSMLSGQVAEPDKDAGSFLVVNDTGAPITTFSIKVNDDFTAKTASVHTCSGAQKGNICDNFTAHGGNGTTFNTGLNGADWDRCTQGATVGQSCTGNSGGVAADFSPGSVTYSWAAQAGKSIPAGATFRISFSGWNNDGWALPPRAYVPNSSGTVSVIDTATNNVIATIGVGDGAVGVSVSPDGSKVYVANANADSVSVIDTASNTVSATIPVGSGPTGVSVTPDGRHVYVANGSSGTVSVIDTASNTVGTTIAIGTQRPFGVSVAPDGAHAYVTNIAATSHTVSVIDTATNTVSTTITVGSEPAGVAFTPDGSKAYVANESDNTVSVIDTATNQVVATIAVATLPVGVCVSPDGSKAYVSSSEGFTVSVIDTASGTVSATIPAGSPFGVSVTPDGAHVYVGTDDGNNVSVIDTVTNTLTATIPVGIEPLTFGNFIQP